MDTDRLGILVKKASLKLDKTAATILAPYDLTLTQYKIVKFLYGAEPGTIRQIDVERFCAMTNPTITGILQNLEKNQWIQRTTNPQDARSKVISLTEKAYTMSRWLIPQSYIRDHPENCVNLQSSVE